MIKLVSVPANQQQVIDWLNKFESVEIVQPDSIISHQPDIKDIYCFQGGNNFTVLSHIRSFAKQLLNTGAKCIFICGSFQFLFSKSEEGEEVVGLEKFDCKVEKLNSYNIGFNKVRGASNNYQGECYFNHRYGVKYANMLDDKNDGDLYLTEDNVLAAIITKQIFGTQFHPELSRGQFDGVFRYWLTGK